MTTDDSRKDEDMTDHERDDDATEKLDLGTAPTLPLGEKVSAPTETLSSDARQEAPAGSYADADRTPAEPWVDPYRGSAWPAPSGRRSIRWGGVVWGLILTVFAGWSLWALSSADRIAGTRAWLEALTPWTAWALGAAILGVIIAVSALLGAIRAAQRRRERPRY